jgi:hypothetical protein
MIDINFYLAQRYSEQPCFDLVADVYQRELGAIAVDYKTINRSVRDMASAFRIAVHKDPHGFAQIAEPVDMCIVLLGKTERMGIHHCGIFYDGRVLHAMPGATLYEEMATIRDRFAVVQFWAKA